MSSSRRLAFVTQWFAPEPSVQPVRIARELAGAGHEVTVLTGMPNYPTGRIHDGYSAWRATNDSFEGLSLRRTPLYPSHDQSAVRRLVNYGSWALSSALFGATALKGKDAVLVYSSPATAAVPAMVARRFWGVPYVLLVQDVWPDSIFASGFLGGKVRAFAERSLNVFVDRTYARSARIAVISPGMKDLLVSRGVAPEKIVLVYNSVESGDEAADVTAPVRQEIGVAEDDVVFMYAGNHGAAQGLEALVDAMGLVPDSSKIKLVMMGEGVAKPALEASVRDRGLTNVTFLPAVPRSRVSGYLQLADVQVVALADEPLFAVTMPSKVQGILASGQPMLAVARGDVANVVVAAGCGSAAVPGDPHSIAAAMVRLSGLTDGELREMGASGRRYYESEMSPEVNRARLVDALLGCADEREESWGDGHDR